MLALLAGAWALSKASSHDLYPVVQLVSDRCAQHDLYALKSPLANCLLCLGPSGQAHHNSSSIGDTL